MLDMTILMAKMTLTVRKPLIVAAPLRELSRVCDLHISGAGYIPAKRDWINQRFDVWAVGFVVSGQGEYSFNGGSFHPIRSGCQFTVFPGAAFSYGPRGTGTWEEYYVIFTGAGVRRWIDAGWFFTDGSVHSLVETGALVERFRELIRVLGRGGRGDADRALVMTERLLLEMYYSRVSVQQAAKSTPTMEAVLSHCHENFAEDIDFIALAEAHAMSYSHLRQQMRRITRVAPHQYIIRLRCESARQLLSDTDLPIKQIAAHVGISDPYTFSRTFSRCVGTSPAAYRKQVAPWANR
jgi:AraC family transcriptional regulator, arabinose operon regulatory protein